MKLPRPKALIAVPIQGEMLYVNGELLGVVGGFGWMFNDNGTPTMRPSVQVILKDNSVATIPAELANTVQQDPGKPQLAIVNTDDL